METKFSKSFRLLVPFWAALWLVAPPLSAQLPPALSVQGSNGSVRLSVTGDVGSACTIQYRTGFSATNNWQFLTNLTPLSSSPYLVADTYAATTRRFYRAFAQEVPANLVTTNMVWIPAGTFLIGSPTNEAMRGSDETQHTVTLSKGFYMGKYAVTQGEYLALMGRNPSWFAGNWTCPVEQVSWDDATNYCAHLTQQEQAAGRLPAGWVYRLPTESEWEHACRAGTATAFNFGSAIRGGMANFYTYYEYDAAIGESYVPNPTPYLNRTTATGSYQPNAWGLYDMHGNVWEWCRDWYGSYPTGSVIDPQGATSGPYRVFRGGSWNSHGSSCRSAVRWGTYPSIRSYLLGFRVVVAQGQP